MRMAVAAVGSAVIVVAALSGCGVSEIGARTAGPSPSILSVPTTCPSSVRNRDRARARVSVQGGLPAGVNRRMAS